MSGGASRSKVSFAIEIVIMIATSIVGGFILQVLSSPEGNGDPIQLPVISIAFFGALLLIEAVQYRHYTGIRSQLRALQENIENTLERLFGSLISDGGDKTTEQDRFIIVFGPIGGSLIGASIGTFVGIIWIYIGAGLGAILGYSLEYIAATSLSSGDTDREPIGLQDISLEEISLATTNDIEQLETEFRNLRSEVSDISFTPLNERIMGTIASNQDTSFTISELSDYLNEPEARVKPVLYQLRDDGLVVQEDSTWSLPTSSESREDSSSRTTGRPDSTGRDKRYREEPPMIIAKPAVKNYMRDKNPGPGFYDELNRKVYDKVINAGRKAKANDRRTVQPSDL